jgi:hypothetical protein
VSRETRNTERRGNGGKTLISYYMHTDSLSENFFTLPHPCLRLYHWSKKALQYFTTGHTTFELIISNFKTMMTFRFSST